MKKLMLALLVGIALLATPASADGGKQVDLLADLYNLDNSATAGPISKLGAKVVRETSHVLKVYYDFSLVGGAVGTVALKDANGKQPYLPKGAIVRDCIIDTITALTSGGSATVALGTGASGADLKAALGYASYTGRVACIPVGTAATAIKLTSNVQPTATIAAAAVTAGKLAILINYDLSD